MIIGITGSFGSGKTTVAKMFARFGAYVIDADNLCHLLMAPSKKIYKKIINTFGEGILNKNKTISRSKLAIVVFKERGKQELLNKLVHPDLISEMVKIIRRKKKTKVIVVDAALLIESGFYKKIDKLVVVKTDIDKQIDRLIRVKKGLTKKEILDRIAMQMPLDQKIRVADFIVDNNGQRSRTLIQVEKIWKTIRGEVCQ